VHADVRDLDRMHEVADEAYEWLGEVDLLVNNAGVAVGGPFDEVDVDDLHFVVDVNLWGVIHGCRAFTPRMKRRGRGYVVNVASSAGLLSPPELGPYNITKAAVISLSETLHAELDAAGVRVTALCPTFFKTNILDSSRGVQNDEARVAARKLMERSSVQADGVARAALAAVHENELYCIPMRDGRMFWRLKRAAPERFAELTSRLMRGTVLDRLFR
jgi:short-subunit dehydrogenase